MKKPYDFTELSNKKCSNCNKTRLKKNLVERKQTATLCHKCYVQNEKARGHSMEGPRRQKFQK